MPKLDVAAFPDVRLLIVPWLRHGFSNLPVQPAWLPRTVRSVGLQLAFHSGPQALGNARLPSNHTISLRFDLFHDQGPRIIGWPCIAVKSNNRRVRPWTIATGRSITSTFLFFSHRILASMVKSQCSWREESSPWVNKGASHCHLSSHSRSPVLHRACKSIAHRYWTPVSHASYRSSGLTSIALPFSNAMIRTDSSRKSTAQRMCIKL